MQFTILGSRATTNNERNQTLLRLHKPQPEYNLNLRLLAFPTLKPCIIAFLTYDLRVYKTLLKLQKYMKTAIMFG